MKKIKLLLIALLMFPILINAECTREGDKFRTDGGLLVDENSGEFNRYCLGIEGCFAKTNEYYDINSNKVTLEEYYESCGCRKDGNTYYDNHGEETTESNYNRICLNVGACSIKDGKYYDNEYKEVTQEVYNSVCGCRIEDNKYYDNNGQETTESNFNRVCLNVGACSIKDGKYYDNEYKETTQENFARICGCRTDNGKYYDRNGNETTFAEYQIQCENPHTGTANVLLITLATFGVVGAVIFIIYRNRKIKEL